MRNANLRRVAIGAVVRHERLVLDWARVHLALVTPHAVWYEWYHPLLQPHATGAIPASSYTGLRQAALDAHPVTRPPFHIAPGHAQAVPPPRAAVQAAAGAFFVA